MNAEIRRDPITVDPLATWANPFEDEAIVFTHEHTYRDILRYIVAELGTETRLHLEEILKDFGHE